MICSGFALSWGSGAKVLPIMGFTTSFIAGMPVLIAGVGSVIMEGSNVFAVGMRLKTLLSESGKISRNPTTPHNATLIHFGADLSNNRIIITAIAA